jgi:hypothetical protein
MRETLPPPPPTSSTLIPALTPASTRVSRSSHHEGLPFWISAWSRRGMTSYPSSELLQPKMVDLLLQRCSTIREECHPRAHGDERRIEIPVRIVELSLQIALGAVVQRRVCQHGSRPVDRALREVNQAVTSTNIENVAETRPAASSRRATAPWNSRARLPEPAPPGLEDVRAGRSQPAPWARRARVFARE